MTAPPHPVRFKFSRLQLGLAILADEKCVDQEEQETVATKTAEGESAAVSLLFANVKRKRAGRLVSGERRPASRTSGRPKPLLRSLQCCPTSGEEQRGENVNCESRLQLVLILALREPLRCAPFDERVAALAVASEASERKIFGE